MTDLPPLLSWPDAGSLTRMLLLHGPYLQDTGNKDMAYRVVADHIRTLCFAIADGARCAREGASRLLHAPPRGTCLAAPCPYVLPPPTSYHLLTWSAARATRDASMCCAACCAALCATVARCWAPRRASSRRWVPTVGTRARGRGNVMRGRHGCTVV